MNKKQVLLSSVLLVLSVVHCMQAAYYMNDEGITFKTIITGNCVTSIDYNMVNDGDGNLGGDKRLLGIHNMTVEIPGYEIVSLIENDTCLYPVLFTMLSNVLSDDNMLVQRWACVKWLLPLSFGFKVENDALTVFSSIWKYRFLSPLRAQKTIDLVKKANFDEAQSSVIPDSIRDPAIKVKSSQDVRITVTINGRTVVASQHTVVQIYSMIANYLCYNTNS